ncbi:TonB-dependent receptor [Caldithrix abyssi]|nr:TonB-dependent receptor [Caldithrix abyssi]
MLNRKKFIVQISVVLLMIGQLFAQDAVSGKVISDDTGEALIGVNIVVKGTGIGTTTDQDGYFSLDAIAADAVLVISYIGYDTKEIAVDGQSEINIVLALGVLSGEDVVVIGYGTQQRKNVTSAISSLKENAFTKGRNTDLQSMLQGRVAGVVVSANNGDIGSAPLIRIRGGTSITAGNGPMIVVDGVPINNTSALPTGFTTGGGAGGDGTQDNPLASLNPNDIASIDILKDASAAAIYGARGGNGVILITTKEGGRGGEASLTYNVYSSSSSIAKKLDLMNASEYKSFGTSIGKTVDDGGANTDWQDAVFRNAKTQNHNIAFSAGTPQTNYRVSVNYLDEQGVILNSQRQRYSARLNVNHKMLDDKLRVGLKVSPSFIKRNNTPYNQRAGFFGGVFANVLKMNPTYPVYNPDGTYFEYPNTTTIRNPVALLNETSDIGEIMGVFFNATAEYEIISGLTGKVNVGLNRESYTRSIYEPNSLPFAAAVGGTASLQNTQRQSVLFEPTLNWKQDMGNSNLEAWAGYSFQEFENSGFGAIAKNFVTDAWLFNNLGGGANFTTFPYSFKDDNRLISFLGRVNYNMGGKYLVSAAIRREGSSRFGDDSKWGLFPSFSLGWRLSEESFMEGVGNDLLNDLKVRVSYGVTGNQDIGNYRSLVTLGPGANAVIGGQLLTGVSANQLANPDLQWETTTQVNFGADFSLLDNRVTGSFDYYNKATRDLLLEFDVPQPAVVGTRLDNVGEVTNKGFEIALSTVNISNPDLFWRTSFNLSSNKNEVVSLGPDKDKFIVTGFVGGAGLSGVQSQIVFKGQPLGTWFGKKFLGFENGQEKLSSTGGPFGDGRLFLGDAQPDFTFGIANNIEYKNFDLSVYISGVQGIQILNNTRMEYQQPSNVKTGNINIFNDTRKDVEDGLDPAASATFSDRFLEDGSFIRLQNITVGYTFDSAQFKNLRIYLSGDNLFNITSYKGYDPEVNTLSGYALGLDYTNYPKARTFTLGINLGL